MIAKKVNDPAPPVRFGNFHLPPITAYPWISTLASGTARAVMVIRALPGKLSPNTVIASGSLPPTFPMTKVGRESYWDGGLFDNTPLGAVLDRLDSAADAERTVYVVNLFPSKGPIPRNLPGIEERMKNLQFANKTLEDIRLLCRFNEVAELMEELESFPDDHPVKQLGAYKAVKRHGYIRVPRIVTITPPEPAGEFDDADFSPEAIKGREDQGHAQALKALETPPQEPCSVLTGG